MIPPSKEHPWYTQETAGESVVASMANAMLIEKYRREEKEELLNKPIYHFRGKRKMEGKTWPDAAGFWISRGQIYFAKASSPQGDYKVRDCRNHEVVSYESQRWFYKGNKPVFPWYPCELNIPREALT